MTQDPRMEGLSTRAGARARLSRRLLRQARSCGLLGSPLYAYLLERTAADAIHGGPTWSVLQGHDMDPPGSAIALRLMGGVHRLALDGRASALAAHLPSCGGHVRDLASAWDAFSATLEERVAELQALLEHPVQTNEVGRSAALVGGFLMVARSFDLPLRVLEIGASGGLNLRWDHFRYEARGSTWGPAQSPVRLCDFDSPPAPPFEVDAQVIERGGCDPFPVDATGEDGALTLMAYVWPDQIHRIRLLRAAIDIARSVPATVDRETAAAWLARRLADTRPGTATIVYHSIVMQYVDPHERAKIDQLFEAIGAEASWEQPLARVEMEPGGEEADVHLTIWPGGKKELIARAGYHGARVRWLGRRS